MKTKLANMLRGKKRKKRKNSNTKLNRGRQRRFKYIKDQLEGEKNSRTDKERNKCIKNNNRL